MSRHVLGITAATILIVLVTLLPFLPGAYDPLAAPLSMMARVFGFIGLSLAPVGLIWLARPRPWVAVAALIVGSLIWVALSAVALMASGFSLGVATFALGAYLFARTSPRLKTASSTAAWYLVVLPLVVFLAQQALVGRGIAFSRERAIRNAAPLIADIERYRESRGHYPPSLLSVWKDYKPAVIGVEKYHYEPSGNAYNLLFEQVAQDLAVREFVVYNPRDEQVASAHAMDLLQYEPERLNRARGYFAVHSAAQPHWKYFWFD